VMNLKQFPQSTRLQYALYLEDEWVLILKFRSGGLYSYSRISPSVWEKLTTAPSPGTYFSAHVVNRYYTVRMDVEKTRTTRTRKSAAEVTKESRADPAARQAARTHNAKKN